MSLIRYNRRNAFAYASRWALGRNPKFYDYTNIGGDCTNFASQCVYAGTGVMNYDEPYGWFYIDANKKSASWTGVQFFYDFMTKNKGLGPFGEDRKLEDLAIGDIIQLGDDSGEFYHTLVLTGITTGNFGNKNYFVSGHSRDVYQKNLDTYDFAQTRGIHILGALTPEIDNEILENTFI